MRNILHRSCRVDWWFGWLALAVTSIRLQGQVTVVGYLQVTNPPGFSMIANPLNHGDNSVGAVLTNGVIDGMTLYKYDPVTQSYSVNQFQSGAWSNPTESFAPGEGGLLFNPTNRTVALTLVGSFSSGSYTNPIPAGFSIRSSILPYSGQLDTVMSFPAAEGDVIYRFDNASGTFKIYTYDLGSWTAPPSLDDAESFFVWKTAATNWVQTYKP